MTTDNPEVDTSNLEGAGGNQPPVSQGQGRSIEGAPQSSQELLELKKDLELTKKELRGLQKRQDTEKNETQRYLDDIKAQVAKGKSIDEAEQIVNADRKAAEKDDLLLKIAAKLGLDESSPNTAGTSAPATDDVTKVFKEYELDPNDPATVGFLSLKGAELRAAVADHAFKKSKQPTLDSSAATSILSNASSARQDVEQLTKKYQTDMIAARGNPGLLKSIKEKARKDGVPVDTIAFV